MDYADLIRRLWHLKFAVLAILLIAVMVGLLSFYRLSFSPFGLHSKTAFSANAGTDLLVEAEGSAFGLTSDSYGRVIGRSRLLVAVLISQPVRELIAARANIPPSELTLGSASVGGDDASRASDAGRATENRVVFTTQEGLPIIGLRAFTTSGRRAEELVNAAIDAAQQYARELQQNAAVPEARQLTLRQLDTPRALVTKEGPTTRDAVFAGAATAAILIVLLLVIDVGVMRPPPATPERVAA